MGRSLSLHDPISYRDPLGPDDQEPEQITKGEAIIRTARLGVPRYIAAQACGVGVSTLRSWEAVGTETAEMDEEALTENQVAIRAFLAGLQKADAEAVAYAVTMVKKAMPENWQAGMTFLERRFPREWSKRIEIDSEPPDRQLTPLDPATVAEIEEAFDAANIPEGIDPASILPTVDA